MRNKAFSADVLIAAAVLVAAALSWFAVFH
jgi:hypothetical protein